MTKPISPSEVAGQKAKSFPSYVFEAFNELIAEKFTAGSATVTQPEAVSRIMQKANSSSGDESLNRSAVFDRGYLNVEEVYREQGWHVDYHKAYAFMNDMGDSYFTFRSK